MLRNPADDHSLLVFDPKIRGKTDRFDLQVQEAALSEARGAKPDERSQLPRLLGAGRAGRRPGAGRVRRGHRRTALASRRSAVASFVGTLWLNALKMTVIPLVVALLVVGIAKSAEAARGGPDRRPFGAVDRDHVHRLGDLRRGDDPCC